MILLPSADEALELASRPWGHGAGPNVLLIHGFAEGRHAWRRMELALAPTHAGVSIDLRGHGDSPHGPAHHYRAAWYAADVLRLVRSWPEPPKAIIGHSLGAEVAIHVAARLALPQMRLAVVEGGPWLNPRSSDIVRTQLTQTPWRFDSVAQFEQLLLARHPMACAEDIRRFANDSLQQQPDGTQTLRLDEQLKTGNRRSTDTDILESMDAIPGPILLVRGEISAITRLPAMLRLKDRLADCRLAIIPLAGHAIMLDNPAAAAAVLTEFLDQLESTAIGCATATLPEIEAVQP